MRDIDVCRFQSSVVVCRCLSLSARRLSVCLSYVGASPLFDLTATVICDRMHCMHCIPSWSTSQVQLEKRTLSQGPTKEFDRVKLQTKIQKRSFGTVRQPLATQHKAQSQGCGAPHGRDIHGMASGSALKTLPGLTVVP